MNELASKLTDTVEKAVSLLGTIDEKTSSLRPGPEKWSHREIIGHLIDSATNNRVRFMNAQFKYDLIFDGYDQNGWVKFMNYQGNTLADLIAKWKQLNLELADLINRMPGTKLLYKTINHNLDKVAFAKVPPDQPASLSYFITDYINHMRHHLNAILSAKFEMLPSEY